MRGLAAMLAATIALAARAASAAPPAFDGLPAPWDGAGLVGAERAGVDAAGELQARLELGYLRRPLRLPTGAALTEQVSDAAVARLGVHAGVFRRRLEVGVVIPVSLLAYTDAARAALGAAADSAVAAGDLRLFLKAGLLDRPSVRLALAAALVAPIGDAGYRSDEAFGAELRLAFDAAWRWLTVVANLGARLHPTVRLGAEELGPELTYQLAFEARLRPRWHLAVEALGSESLLPIGGRAQRTLLVALSARVRAARGLDLWLGLGRSVAPEAARTDDVRVLAGLAWAPAQSFAAPAQPAAPPPVAPPPLLDRDGDGVPDALDRCPLEPEDRDGYLDHDGCPDPDNDGDGIPDALDRCPNEPETLNGIDDGDGCPDEGGQGGPPRAALELPAPLLFAAGQTRLTPAMRAALDRAFAALAAHPEARRVRIEGHALAEPHPTELAAARALAVRAYLVDKGIAPERLQAVGYGDKRRLATPAASRRVELIPVEP